MTRIHKRDFDRSGLKRHSIGVNGQTQVRRPVGSEKPPHNSLRLLHTPPPSFSSCYLLPPPAPPAHPAILSSSSYPDAKSICKVDKGQFDLQSSAYLESFRVICFS
ncbi:unnamed protein product [Pleuronectes platessa]|uniref:Uncharacterized protein n=1 Tax=Pleuronectes platessa TaxID=8262 RepID=A0A9N7VSE3_PLEPL|nr:unnamed protein product [Pleuronectes platessa]